MPLDIGESFLSVKLGLAHAEEVEVRSIDDGDFHSPVSPSSQARNFATSSSDSCACGSRGFTRGVGIGGVGGVLVLPAVGTALKAPASRDAARASEGFTVAPANTASSDAPGAAVAIGGGGAAGGAGGVSGCALPAERIPPPVARSARGGR